MREKDIVKLNTNAYENLGIKKGDLGEVFLTDQKSKIACVVFLDFCGVLKNALTLGFDELEIVKSYDDLGVWKELLGEGFYQHFLKTVETFSKNNRFF